MASAMDFPPLMSFRTFCTVSRKRAFSDNSDRMARLLSRGIPDLSSVVSSWLKSSRSRVETRCTFHGI